MFIIPPINEYKCSKCGFTLPEGWGGYMYVENNAGRRIVCSHPGGHTVERVLGRRAPRELVEARTGFNSHCICLKCLHLFEADLRDEIANPWRVYYEAPSLSILLNGIRKLLSVNEKCIPIQIWEEISKGWKKDERKCPRCGSTNVKTEFELIGEPCPICGEGVIEEIETGRMC